ncbi:hypothetical protein BSKO_11629 [Bryopsis sp. KO-2023]|nr:hypothetical protein BSKO_11629 [Bryopsis sp. KO-2023]
MRTRAGKRLEQIKNLFKRDAWKILRGDKVVITVGKDKGQTGVVSRVLRNVKRPRVVVEGRNLVQKHIKRQGNQRGQVVSVESPIHYSNVQLIDPVNQSPVRCQWRYLEDGTKVRISVGRKASGSVIPRPDILLKRQTPISSSVGVRDTPMSEARKVTYTPSSSFSTWTGFAASGVY